MCKVEVGAVLVYRAQILPAPHAMEVDRLTADHVYPGRVYRCAKTGFVHSGHWDGQGLRDGRRAAAQRQRVLIVFGDRDTAYGFRSRTQSRVTRGCWAWCNLVTCSARRRSNGTDLPMPASGLLGASTCSVATGGRILPSRPGWSRWPMGRQSPDGPPERGRRPRGLCTRIGRGDTQRTTRCCSTTLTQRNRAGLLSHHPEGGT